MENNLLLIVDVQRGFITDRTAHIIPRISELVTRKIFPTIVFTQYFNTDASPYEKYLNWFKLKTSEEQALAGELEPFATLVFRKQVYTAVDAEMKKYLKNNNISTVYIAGVDTDCCVLTSAADLFQIGIRPVVLADYCASNGGPESHDAALKVLIRLIGQDQIKRGTL